MLKTLYLQALELYKELGHQEGMASQYGNLGLLDRLRGNLDQAKTQHNRAIELYQALGDKEGIARQYGNLGGIFQIQGDLDHSESLYNQALELYKGLGHQEGIANQYSTLAHVARLKGDLDNAEKLYRQALEIHQRMQYVEGMGDINVDLGVLHWMRSDLDQAEFFYNRALELYEQLQHLDGMASGIRRSWYSVTNSRRVGTRQSCLTNLLWNYTKILGTKKVVANQYGELGIVARIRGDLGEAEEFHQQALELYKELNHLEGIASELWQLGSGFADIRRAGSSSSLS